MKSKTPCRSGYTPLDSVVQTEGLWGGTIVGKRDNVPLAARPAMLGSAAVLHEKIDKVRVHAVDTQDNKAFIHANSVCGIIPAAAC